MIRELKTWVSELILLFFFFFFRTATWACTVWSGIIFFFFMGVEFPHGLWKTVWIHDMRDNIHILKKKWKLGVYQVFANSEMRGNREGLFDFTEKLPGQAHSFMHRMPCGCVKHGLLGALHAVIFHTSIRWTQDVTGVSQGPFRHSFH